MKKILALIIAVISVSTSMIGCSKDDGKDDNDSLIINNMINDSINVDDIKYEFKEATVNNTPIISFNYTNNSKYTVVDVEVRFKLKDGVTDEQLDIYKSVWDDVKSVWVLGYNRKVAEPGETAENSPCVINGTHTLVQKMEQMDLMEPETISVGYIGNDNKAHVIKYDYNTKKTKESKQVIELNQWIDNDLSKMIPRPDLKLIDIKSDKDDDDYRFTAYGCDEKTYNSYINDCKDKGFNIDPKEKDSYYRAKNSDGYEVYVSYTETEESIYVKIEKD